VKTFWVSRAATKAGKVGRIYFLNAFACHR
jgi:hypothetical protein